MFFWLPSWYPWQWCCGWVSHLTCYDGLDFGWFKGISNNTHLHTLCTRFVVIFKCIANTYIRAHHHDASTTTTTTTTTKWDGIYGMAYMIGLNDKSHPLKKECISIHVKSKSPSFIYIYIMFIFHREQFQKVRKFTKNCWKEVGIILLTSKKEKWS